MAKTFYGYAERQAEDNVDWSLIGKDITDMLQEEVQRRDKLKSDIDDATRKYGETLSNAPTGQHKGASDGVLEFASNAQQARLVQDRLLKSGQLKVKDYLKQRQNLTDGTKGLFAAAKDFQALYQTKVDKMTEGESARLEMYLFEMSEGFGNWNTAGAYINPTTYEVSLGKKHKVKGKDGNYVYEMGDRPEEYFTISELRNYVTLDLKRFDTKGALDKAAASLGKRSENITYQTTVDGVKGTRTINVADISGDVYKKLIAQGVLTKDQISVIDAFEKYKESIVNEMTAIPYNELSILTDYIKVGEDDKQFAFVWSEEQRKEVEGDGKEAILLEKDPQSGRPKVLLTPEQKGYIGDKITMGLKQRLDQSVTDTFTPEKKEKRGGGGNNTASNSKESISSYWDSWIKPLFTGTPKDVKNALTRLSNSEDLVKEARLEINNDTGDVALKYEMVDGTTAPIFFISGQDIKNGNVDLRSLTGDVFFNDYIKLADRKTQTKQYKQIIDSAGVDNLTLSNYQGFTNLKPSINDSNIRILASRAKGKSYKPLNTGGTSKGSKVTFYDEYVNNFDANNTDAASIVSQLNSIFKKLPDGAKSMSENPFNDRNLKIKAEVGDSYKTTLAGNQNIVFTSPLGPPVFIPASDENVLKIKDLMQFFEQKIRKGNKFTLKEVASSVFGKDENSMFFKILETYNNKTKPIEDDDSGTQGASKFSKPVPKTVTKDALGTSSMKF